jgi:hypothetical protein
MYRLIPRWREALSHLRAEHADFDGDVQAKCPT